MCDMPRFSEERTVRASKVHRCSLCYWEIYRGEHHVVISGCWDGRMDRFRMHRDCRDAHAAIARAEWNYDWCAPMEGCDLEDIDVLRKPGGGWEAVIT